MIVVGYEYFGKPYVIGEAPGRRNGGLPLEGARRRIGALIGLTAEDMAEMFHWENLLDAWPGYGPNGGSKFPMSDARARASYLFYEKHREHPFILLGKRVAAAFGVPTNQPWFVWRADVAVCPHPSGLSRWWNDPENVESCREFWRTQVLMGSWRD